MKKSLALLLIIAAVCSLAALGATVDEKVIYLTFDDGPTQNTPQILEILKKYNAKATFFLLEDRMKEFPDYVKRLYSEGHSIGLHGQSHDVNIIYSTPSEPLVEMNGANKVLYDTVGFKTKLIRTPYGSYPYMTYEQYKILKAANYNLWDWTVDPRDGVGTPDMQSILRHIKTDLKNNEYPIVLLHDRKATANKLDSILSYFTSQGYTFDIINENMDPVNFMELYGPAREK